MRIEKISYSQSRESVNSIGLKKWDKVGVEAELRDGDIYEECFTELKKEVDGFYNSINPRGVEITETVFGKLPEIDPKKQDLEDKINDCTSIGELNLLMNDSMRYGLVEQFITKKKSFQ